MKHNNETVSVRAPKGRMSRAMKARARLRDLKRARSLSIVRNK